MLRLDPNFVLHPKVTALSPRLRWLWLGVLCSAAKYQTDALTPQVVAGVKSLTLADLDAFVAAKLLDIQADGVARVHDWAAYNGPDLEAAARMREVRARAPQPTGERWKAVREAVGVRDGGICFDCGLPAGARWRAEHHPSRAEVAARGGDALYDAAHVVTRCPRCSARRTARPELPEHVDELERLMHRAGWGAAKRAAARTDPERAISWLQQAFARPELRSPAAWAWACFEAGDELPETDAVADAIEACRRWLASPAVGDEAEAEVRDELDRIARKRGAVLTDAQVDTLLAEWRGGAPWAAP